MHSQHGRVCISVNRKERTGCWEKNTEKDAQQRGKVRERFF